MRLIEIENVIRVIDRYISDGDTNLNIKLAITNIPTVDTEPVVRCKDCAHPERSQPGMVYCPNIVGGWVDDNGYCSYGKKKKEAEWDEPDINPCRGCDDYDGEGGCLSNGGCGAKMDEVEDE